MEGGTAAVARGPGWINGPNGQAWDAWNSGGSDDRQKELMEARVELSIANLIYSQPIEAANAPMKNSPKLFLNHRERNEPHTPRGKGDEQGMSSKWRSTPSQELGNLLLVPPRKRLRQHGSGNAPGQHGAHRSGTNTSKRSGGVGSHSSGGGGNGGGHNQANGGGENTSGAGGPNNNGIGNADRPAGDNSGYESDDREEIVAEKVDTQCCWCDDGGLLLECGGRCRRSFHVGLEMKMGAEGEPPCYVPDPKSDCNILDLSPDMANALVISSAPFLCPNCLSKEQMCFYCGRFGEEASAVKKCKVASCGRFYHERCIKDAKKSVEIASRSFGEVCPLHWCLACKRKEKEVPNHPDNELVACRRCPRAYHRSCIPTDMYGGDHLRIWLADYVDGKLAPGVLVETSLLYCMEHKMEESGVPTQRPMFPEYLLKKWQLHYAKKFPHLRSAKDVFERLGRDEEEEAAWREEEVLEEEEEAARGDSNDVDALSIASIRNVDSKSAMLRVKNLYAQARQEVLKKDLIKQTRAAFPNNGPMKKSIDEDVLKALEETVSYASKIQDDNELLTTLLNRKATLGILRNLDDEITIMAPYVHGTRYTTYGQDFTDSKLLPRLCNHLAPLLWNNDVLVDFNCGKNEFIPLMKEIARQDGIVVEGRAYDIIVAKDLTGFALKPWLNTKVEKENLGHPDRLVIGLNPPIGKDNGLANKFVSHAVKFRPRLIVLIVPPATQVPPGYKTIYEDRHFCRGEYFHVPDSDKSSWSKEITAFRILARTDLGDDVLFACASGGNAHWQDVPVPRG